MTCLETAADLATIATAVVAVFGYGSYRWTLFQRRRRVEAVLAKKNSPGDDSLSVRQLAVELILTDNQVIEAASRSRKIEPKNVLNDKDYHLRLKKGPNPD